MTDDAESGRGDAGGETETRTDGDADADARLVDRCVAEVDELHAFFELWFAGELAQDRETFERFEGVLADDFTMIQPSGLRRSKSGIAADVFDAHGTHPSVTVDATTFEPRYVDAPACLGTYEEYQTVDGERTGRTSTVLFRAAPDCPNGVAWVHLHETWLDG